MISSGLMGAGTLVIVLFVITPLLIPAFARSYLHRFRLLKHKIDSRFESVKYTRFGYKWDASWRIRNLAISVLDELATFLVHFKMNSAVAFVSLTIVVMSISIPVYFSDKIGSLTGVISSTLLALLAIFITAAVFMATLSRQGLDRQSEKDADFLMTVRKNGSVLRTIFVQLIDNDIESHQRYTLLAGFAAGTVFDNRTYKSFHTEVIKHKDAYRKSSEYFSYGNSIYQLSIDATNWRFGNISSVLDLWVEAGSKIKGEDLRISNDKFTKLYEACREYEATPSPDTYSQGVFLGPQLTRVVIYGTLAVLVSPFYIFFESIESIHPFVIDVLISLLLMIAFIGLALSLRYLLNLLRYFRTLSNTYTYRQYWWWNESGMDDNILY
jgi:hypothetical protein